MGPAPEGCMRASIAMTDLQRIKGSTGTALAQAIVDAARALVADPLGHATYKDEEARMVRHYIYTGPPELVRPCIAAHMAFLEAVGP